MYSIIYFATSGIAFSVVQRYEIKTREEGVVHGQVVWAALREKFDGYSREVLRAAHLEIETVKMWWDEDPMTFSTRTGAVTVSIPSPLEEAPSIRQYEDIIMQYLSLEYDRIRQNHFEREDCNLVGIRRLVLKIYTENLARSNSDLSKGIARYGVDM